MELVDQEAANRRDGQGLGGDFETDPLAPGSKLTLPNLRRILECIVGRLRFKWEREVQLSAEELLSRDRGASVLGSIPAEQGCEPPFPKIPNQ
ncbi:hypothetical protein DPEC_G00226120 [Dallia pectoralis]|uniref:Uncharacterized protein n=1 Tax=Dallia pectoralis TaxID=75939 RepID=A0ACC2G0T4_DALPE|nr:hypothetical protein DPEC_G00226120 [Dallia pectoralis]